MTLKADTRIKQYEIRSLLGVGGMGEVYLAHDTTLERDVAIKFLKQTDDREKLARFRREAKVVSSLNHPNIVTIFEVGKYDNRHYIVTELVRGKVLRRVITEKSLSVSEIIEIGIQIGNALAAAHEAKIIHRDIKPENIMVMPDGYVKVLDFGLAKLTGAEEVMAVSDSEATNTLIQTRSGMILGTVSYMSPEQLRGKGVDERADIWSLGVCLYEMIASRRPFEGDSVSDVIASVLNQTLPPLDEIGFAVSPELQEIIEKCLAKDKNERYLSATELIAELKELRMINTTSKPPGFIKGESTRNLLKTKLHQQQNTDTHSEKKKSRWKTFAAAFMLLFAALGGYYLYQNFAAPFSDTNRELKIKRLQMGGNVKNAVISPEGRFIVYVQSENGQDSLWLRETEEAGGKNLIPASQVTYGGLAFSSDGNFIYFTRFEKSSSSVLYRIRLFGGSQQEIAQNVDSPVAFSPDGKYLAFIRAVPQQSADHLILIEADGINERVLTEIKRPEFFFSGSAKEGLAFSPDGKTIAAPVGKTDTEGDSMSVVGIDAESGQIRELTAQRWFRVGRIVWVKQSNELLITAVEIGSDLFQIFKVSPINGKTQKVAPNLSDYYNLSLTKDGTRLLGLTYDKDVKLFTAASDNPTRITPITGGGGEGAEGAAWSKDGRIIYTSTKSGNRDIWITSADGKNQLQLTFDKATDEYASISADGKIVFISSRSGAPHIWQMNSEGRNARQITSKGGESFPQITPDAATVVFTAFSEKSKVLWKMPADGGEPVQLTTSTTGWILANWAAISPDGKTAACLSKDNIEAPIKLSIVSIETGSFLNTFTLPGGIASPDKTPVLRWTADGKSISFIVTRNGVSNIWAQPLAGGEAKQITDFSSERIFSFDWSKDGKQIVYSRGVVRNNLVLIEDF